MSIDWKAFTDIIHSANDFVLTSHVRPDCDALGSELGMAGILKKLGKKVRIANGHPTPPNLAFIDRNNEIMCIGDDVQVEELIDADVHMILDTSAWVQLGGMKEVIEKTKARVVILDHHVSEDDLGAVVFKNTTAEATGRLVVEAADALGVELDESIATPLFSAIATDTGWFRFPSTGAGTYECAARLVQTGTSPTQIFADLYENETLGRVRLRGRVLSRVELELDGRLTHTFILEGDYEETGALPSDTEDLINQALAISGTIFAVILIEQPAGGFKISFRSKCGVQCNEVAAEFGGGGHKAAAGAFVKGEFAEVQNRVLAHVRQALQAELVG